MNLYFLRHAKTERISNTGEDFDRKLAPKGVAQLTMLNRSLSTYPIVKVVCSAAVRTKQTHLGLISLKNIESEYTQALYLANHTQWISAVKNQGCDHCLFIGHNDGISAFVSWLTGEEVNFQTASFIHVYFTAGELNCLASGTALLKFHYRPDVSAGF